MRSFLSIEINKGEVAAIIGLNDTGKTTLMEIMMKLWKADKGDIEIMGKNINEEKSIDVIRSELGVIFQEGGMYNDMKLKEALDLSASFYNISKYKVKRLIEEFDLKPYMNTHGIGLSKIREIVEEYRGTMDIQVKETFYLSITLKV